MSFFIRRGRGRGGTSLPNKLTERVSSSTGSSFNQNLNPRKRGFREQSQQQRGRGRGKRVAHGGPPPKRREEDDEEITSESEDEETQQQKLENAGDEDDDFEQDDEGETEQEARVRLAKEQIKELRKKIVERHGRVANDDDVGELIREQELQEEGKVLRKVVTDEFVGKELRTEVLVTGNVIKSPLTCIRSTSTSIYASTKSGTIVSFTFSTRKRIHRTLTPPPVTSLAVSDSTLAASTPQSIHLLNPTDLSTTHTFSSSRNAICLSLSTDTLFSTHKDRTVKLWNIPERAYVESLFGHQDVPTCVDVMASNRVVTSGGFDKTLRVWKIDEESQLVYNWDQDIIDVVKVISGGFFVGGSTAGDLALFSFGRKKPLCVVPRAHGVDENGVGRWITCIGGIGDLVASGSDDGVVKVWRVVARKLEFVRDVGVPQGVVVGIEVFEGDCLKLVVGVGTEVKGGRWSGRKANCSRIVEIC